MIQRILKKFNINIEDLPKRYMYMIIIGLIGLILMIISNVFTKNTSPSLENEQPPLPIEDSNQTIDVNVNEDDYSADSIIEQLETKLEEQLKSILEMSEAISNVEVMINLDSTNINIYEKDFIKGKQVTDETDQSGGERKVQDNTEETQIVLIRRGDQENPLLIQTQKPDVRGVLVVAQGLENVTTQQSVIDSISKVLDVPSHRISVMNKE